MSTDRIQQDAEVEMQVAQGQPSEIIRNKRLIDAVDAISTEVLERRQIRQDRDDAKRTGTDQTCHLVLHLHASQSKNNERQQRQKHDKYRVTIHNSYCLSFHILDSLNLIALEVAIHVDDNSDGNSTFGCSNTDHKEGHKHAFHTVWIKQTVDGDEVDIHSIENQLDRDEHGNQVTTGIIAYPPFLLLLSLR